MRRLWIALGVLIVGAVLAVLGLNWWVQAYLRGEAFRQLVAARTGQALRADVDAQPLRWSGSSVFSAAFTARGESGAPLEGLVAEQVRADVDWRGVFEGAWRVNRIDIVRLDARLRTEPQRVATAGEAGPAPDSPPPRRGWWPQRFELRRVSVQDANVSVGMFGSLRGTGLTMQPEGDGWIFDGTRGRLELPGFAPLSVDGFRVRLQQGVAYVTDAALRLGANGALTISGEIGGRQGPFDLQTRWRNVDAGDLLDATWKPRLSGLFSGEARSVGRVGKSPFTKGKFLLRDGRLEGVPILREIAQFTRSPQFERLPLREVSADFETDGAETTVRNFVAESPALLRVEGKCHIAADGTLRGRFRVGVTTQTLQWLPGSQEKVFVAAQGGYLWTEVKIGGTVENPTEDLSGRLARAMGEQVIDTGVELLKDAPSNATDAVQRAIDLLGPLIP